MTELRDGPLRGGVTLRAVGSEKTLMAVFCLVAGRAVQERFLGMQMLRRKVRRIARLFEPPLRLPHIRDGLRRLAFNLFEANTCKRNVIHLRRP